jgi:predicted FMN-binding regulatory protein PaiB
MFQPAAPTMDASTRASLRSLLTTQPVGALATLHRGEPALSMVPFVLPAGAAHFVIHVSALATHTADMAAHARGSAGDGRGPHRCAVSGASAGEPAM